MTHQPSDWDQTALCRSSICKLRELGINHQIEVLWAFTWKPRPESGLDCLICAEFARRPRRRGRELDSGERPQVLAGILRLVVQFNVIEKDDLAP